MKQSYIMIKPDGQRYLTEIDDIIKDNDFRIVSMYRVKDWETISSKIYEDCLNANDELFRLDYLAHVWLDKYLFGNSAIVMILEKDGLEGIRLLEEIMCLKKTIRKTFNATKTGVFMVVMDVSKIGLPGISPRGTLAIKSDDIILPVDDYMMQEGNFRAFFFQYVHCPDANIYEAKNEMQILEANVISSENLITFVEWQQMKKYKSIQN